MSFPTVPVLASHEHDEAGLKQVNTWTCPESNMTQNLWVHTHLNSKREMKKKSTPIRIRLGEVTQLTQPVAIHGNCSWYFLWSFSCNGCHIWDEPCTVRFQMDDQRVGIVLRKNLGHGTRQKGDDIKKAWKLKHYCYYGLWAWHCSSHVSEWMNRRNVLSFLSFLLGIWFQT